MKSIYGIASCGINWGIGYNGGLLWKDSVDMAFFKKHTLHKTVVMGSKTAISLPNSKPLINRQNIVLTRNKNLKLNPGFQIATYLDEVMQLVLTNELWVIGGAQIYGAFLEQVLIEKMYINMFNLDCKADTYFPYDILKQNYCLKNVTGISAIISSILYEPLGDKRLFLQN